MWNDEDGRAEDVEYSDDSSFLILLQIYERILRNRELHILSWTSPCPNSHQPYHSKGRIHNMRIQGFNERRSRNFWAEHLSLYLVAVFNNLIQMKTYFLAKLITNEIDSSSFPSQYSPESYGIWQVKSFIEQSKNKTKIKVVLRRSHFLEISRINLELFKSSKMDSLLVGDLSEWL